MSEKESPARERGAKGGVLRDAQPIPETPDSSKPDAIRVELIGDDIAEALGFYRVQSSSPVLAVCRDLTEDGAGQHLPLEAWRGPILCLRVRSIGEAAGLEVNGPGTGFCQRARLSIAPPMRQTALGATLPAPSAPPAPPASPPPATAAPRFAVPLPKVEKQVAP